MRTFLRFAILALGFGWLAVTAPFALAAAVFTHASLACALVAAGYAGAGPRVYGKSARHGRIPLASRLALLPVHALNALAFRLVRAISSERPCDEVLPGVFLGRRLVRGDEAILRETGARAVLDLTSEFDEARFATALQYRCLPVLDDAAPSAAQLAEGVAWLAAAPRPVYVHCALGHGRSATFVAALALATGAAADAAAAEALLRAKRRGVRLAPSQRAALVSVTPAMAR